MRYSPQSPSRASSLSAGEPSRDCYSSMRRSQSPSAGRRFLSVDFLTATTATGIKLVNVKGNKTCVLQPRKAASKGRRIRKNFD